MNETTYVIVAAAGALIIAAGLAVILTGFAYPVETLQADAAMHAHRIANAGFITALAGMYIFSAGRAATK